MAGIIEKRHIRALNHSSKALHGDVHRRLIQIDLRGSAWRTGPRASAARTICLVQDASPVRRYPGDLHFLDMARTLLLTEHVVLWQQRPIWAGRPCSRSVVMSGWIRGACGSYKR